MLVLMVSRDDCGYSCGLGCAVSCNVPHNACPREWQCLVFCCISVWVGQAGMLPAGMDILCNRLIQLVQGSGLGFSLRDRGPEACNSFSPSLALACGT